jgi:hypothetical protein
MLAHAAATPPPARATGAGTPAQPATAASPAAAQAAASPAAAAPAPAPTAAHPPSPAQPALLPLRRDCQLRLACHRRQGGGLKGGVGSLVLPSGPARGPHGP